jgi:hypothetical protein
MNVLQLLQQYKNHTGTLPNGRHYKRIGNNVCHLFSGRGWNIPTVYRLIKGVWVYVSGPQLPEPFNV